MRFLKIRCFLFFIICMQLRMTELWGQSFKLMRYDESYLYIQDSARTFYNTIKFLPLSKNKQFYASFGGEARWEYVAFDNEDWGRLNTGHNNFLLQRYDLGADFHLGKRIRIFFQMRSALQGGRKNGPRPIDEDQLNIQNMFLDAVIWHKSESSLTFRIGKQELDYGSSRLISVRDGPNVRLYFTGAKMMFSSPRFFADAFVMMSDTLNPGVFDNKSTGQANLWGTYSTWIIPRSGNFDFFYLGIYRNASTFEEGTEKEIRHTVGSRFWKYGGGFIYNLEFAYQFGKFGNGQINAWAGSIDLGYYFEYARFKPSINLRNDYISGDNRKGDGNLQSFNPIFPKGGYFGFNPQIGPVNLLDIHPYLTMSLLSNLTFQADVLLNWRYSLQDGIYRPSGAFNLPGAGSQQRYIGTSYLATFFYSFNRFISLNAGVQYFKTGAFIRDIILNPKDGVFLNARIKCMF